MSPVTQLKRQVQLSFCDYLLAEAVGLLTGLVTVTLAARLTNNSLIWIAASVYSSSIGYYTVLVAGTWCFGQGDTALTELNRCQRGMPIIRTLVLELGSAELLDSLLFSPLLLYFSLRLLPNPQLALVLSELLSTVAFYTTLLIVKSWQRKGCDSNELKRRGVLAAAGQEATEMNHTPKKSSQFKKETTNEKKLDLPHCDHCAFCFVVDDACTSLHRDC